MWTRRDLKTKAKQTVKTMFIRDIRTIRGLGYRLEK